MQAILKQDTGVIIIVVAEWHIMCLSIGFTAQCSSQKKPRKLSPSLWDRVYVKVVQFIANYKVKDEMPAAFLYLQYVRCSPCKHYNCKLYSSAVCSLQIAHCTPQARKKYEIKRRKLSITNGSNKKLIPIDDISMLIEGCSHLDCFKYSISS